MILTSPFLQSPTILSPNSQHHNKSLSPKHHNNISFIPSSTSTSTSNSTTSSSSEPQILNNSFYELLGVPVGASSEQVKSAYRKLARVCHPDVAASDTSAEEFMKINTAYSTLLDPEKRADYDRTLFRVRRRYTTLRASGQDSRAPVYSQRNWETDQCW